MKFIAGALILALAIPYVAAGCGEEKWACCKDGSCKAGLTCVGGGCFPAGTCGSNDQGCCTNNVVKNRCQFGLRCQQKRCLPFTPAPPTNTGGTQPGPASPGQPANPAPLPSIFPAGIPGFPLASGVISGDGIVQVGGEGNVANVGYGETFSTKLNGGAAKVIGRESLAGRSDGGGSGQTSLVGATEVLPGNGGLSSATGTTQNGFVWNFGKGTGLAENRMTLSSTPDQAAGETKLRTLSVGLEGAGASSKFNLQTVDP